MTDAVSHRRAYSLIELVATIVAVTTILAAIAPAVGSLRGEGHDAQSQANLMQLGQMRDQYAGDNQNRIYTYTWQAGETYMLPDGRLETPGDPREAASLQSKEILQRRTGRISGVYKILNYSHLPQRRYAHLVLFDYWAGDDDDAFVSPVVIDPADGNQLNWKERPLEYREQNSSLPFVQYSVNGYDNSNSWDEIGVIQRWPFASSYQTVPAAWQAESSTDTYIPVDNTPHLMLDLGEPDLSGRYLTEVAFPGKKVHLHEEFDREQRRSPYFAYDHAQPSKLMFDGSINTRPSGEANDSVNPAEPGKVWTQRYIPLHTFPIPITGMGEETELNMRYRWTDGGLGGVDYD